MENIEHEFMSLTDQEFNEKQKQVHLKISRNCSKNKNSNKTNPKLSNKTVSISLPFKRQQINSECKKRMSNYNLKVAIQVSILK